MLELLFLATGTTYFLKAIFGFDNIVAALILILLVILGVSAGAMGITIPRIR